MIIGRIVDHQIQLNIDFQTLQSEVDKFIQEHMLDKEIDNEEGCKVLSALIHLRNSIQYALKEIRECKETIK